MPFPKDFFICCDHGNGPQGDYTVEQLKTTTGVIGGMQLPNGTIVDPTINLSNISGKSSIIYNMYEWLRLMSIGDDTDDVITNLKSVAAQTQYEAFIEYLINKLQPQANLTSSGATLPNQSTRSPRQPTTPTLNSNKSVLYMPATRSRSRSASKGTITPNTSNNNLLQVTQASIVPPKKRKIVTMTQKDRARLVDLLDQNRTINYADFPKYPKDFINKKIREYKEGFKI